ncbi:MAG: cell division protein FtsZ, partial [Clostridia bacterium]
IGIKKLSEYVDSLIVIPNERLKLLTDKRITFLNAFHEADDILCKGVQSICDLITVNGYINLDFADIATVMTNAGLAHMGVGVAKGREKASLAAKMAMSSPLLETKIGGAKGIIVNITSSPDIGLDEIDEAVSMITNEANPDSNVIFGVAFDNTIEDEIRITLIATGFEAKPNTSSSAANSTYSRAESTTSSTIGTSTAKETQKSTSDETKVDEDDINSIIAMLNKNRNKNN